MITQCPSVIHLTYVDKEAPELLHIDLICFLALGQAVPPCLRTRVSVPNFVNIYRGDQTVCLCHTLNIDKEVPIIMLMLTYVEYV